MTSRLFAATCLGIYFGLLFLIALWARQRADRGRNPANHKVVYSLSLAVYCTSWTFYGSVGSAVRDGPLFLTIYLGPTLFFLLGWPLLVRAVRLKQRTLVTSVADFAAVLFGKSQMVATAATLVVAIGVIPYLSLQLRAVFSTFALVTDRNPVGHGNEVIHYAIAVVLILFTIAFGARRLDPAERHPGIIVAMAVECVVKLLAFLAVGIFATWWVFHGFGDLVEQTRARNLFTDAGPIAHPGFYAKWGTYMVLSFFAIFLLPRQFHVSVVENSNEQHLRTAGWLFPSYLILINLFVLPIAAAGILTGLPMADADMFVLELPMAFGNAPLAFFAFLGGFSAATGMVVVSSMTLAMMVTNHLFLPVVDRLPWRHIARRHLLRVRWLAIAAIITVAHSFDHALGESYSLVNIGILAFAAVFQLAPPILGRLVWQRSNKIGAFCGFAAGFGVWCYALLLPTLAHSGVFPLAFLSEGPLGLTWLRPEHLFGVTSLDPVTHAVFWSLVANVTGLVVGSLAGARWLSVGMTADDDWSPEVVPDWLAEGSAERFIELNPKLHQLRALLHRYLPQDSCDAIVTQGLAANGLAHRTHVTIAELLELHGACEAKLAGAIGAANAHRVFRHANFLSTRERDELSNLYAKMLADLKVSPQELRQKIDYHREMEILLARHADELNAKIAERDRAQNELLRLGAAVEQAAEAIFVTDPRGTVQYVNPAFEVAGGRTKDDLVGQRLEDCGFQLANSVQRGAVAASLREGLGWSGRVGVKMADGSLRTIEANVSPVTDSNGQICNFVAVARDVSSEVQIERRLREAQKLEALGTLAGGIAHDFNNLLMPILGSVQNITSTLENDHPARTGITQIRTAAEHARDLVRQILTFARHGEQADHAVSVAALVRDTLKLLRASIPATIEIEDALSDRKATVHIEPTQIHQILVNLCTNAAQAMEQRGGKLHVGVDAIEVDTDLASRVHGLHCGNYVRMRVADTGEGMSPSVQSRIFEPFFTTKPRGKGTGLGMAVVHGIVQTHGGAISIESQSGNGTTVDVYLPTSTAAPLPEAAPQPDGVRGTERILFVDDEDIIVDVCRIGLEQLGYRVVATSDAQRALDWFASDPHGFDVIITDYTMPRISGIALAEKATRLRDGMPIILCTGYAERLEQEDRIRAGIADVLLKPLTPAQLAAAIRRHIKPEQSG